MSLVDVDFVIDNTILSMKKKQFKAKEVRSILKKRGIDVPTSKIINKLEELRAMDLAKLEHKRYELTMQ